ncbi:MAG TPA: cell division protein ZipA C-terminal FtsZ-binding domain-containing protein [Methylotenera sp.]|nr:cell division protein ZipA C-terminal FtsZ-binding domain-containing protein [Methylotenera sp.]
MSELQLALIILGAFIIGGVLVYNWLQEKKLRKQVTSDFIVPQKDVLTDDFHINTDAYIIDKDMAEVAQKSKHFQQHTIPNEMPAEEDEADIKANQTESIKKTKPSQSYVESQILASQVDLKTAAEPAVEPSLTEPIIKAVLHEKIQAAQVNLPESVHPQIDLTAILYANKNIHSQDLNTLKEALSHISLPSTLHGLDAHDKWHAVDDAVGEAFKQVACSLQLADRGGPVPKNLLNKFQFAVEDTGLALNTHVEWQGSGDAMQRAIELDQFCIEVDQMISVHIAQADAPIHGTKFKGLAEASGMVLKDDGKYYFYANDAALFTAIDTNNIPFTTEGLRSNVLKSITLQIEIPKVNNCEQVFNQMILMAQKMASSLGANLVDDNQKQLGDLQIEKIRQQLKVIHATMVARGIMPGSPSSMRLFN